MRSFDPTHQLVWVPIEAGARGREGIKGRGDTHRFIRVSGPPAAVRLREARCEGRVRS